MAGPPRTSSLPDLSRDFTKPALTNIYEREFVQKSVFFKQRPYSSQVPFSYKCVSKWERRTVEDVFKIYYNDNFCGSPSDIMSRIGFVGNLSKEQKEYIETIKKYLHIDVGDGELSEVYIANVPRDRLIVDSKLKEILENLDNEKEEYTSVDSGSVYNYVCLGFWLTAYSAYSALTYIFRHIRGRVYKFICSITDLLDALQVCRNISDAYDGGHYTTLFRTFADLCCLNAKLGFSKSDQSTWKNLGDLDNVISQPNIRLFKHGVFTKSSIDRNRVVSVVQVKKRRHQIDLDSSDSDGEACTSTSSFSSMRSSNSSDSSEDAPKIELLLNNAVLGQHAGELLLDLNKFVTKDCDTDKYKMSGMIVNGTMVFVTVLEMSRQHYIKLAANKELEDGDKAIIYYSRPFNILNESDRNVLIESFVRLNNMQR
ncbi:uncharacterized protein LOC134691393 isoform X1 [Mytilus trossulus]|uniref:uncharacterized protein LOC134691393 isoform X1 n=1 Tax=Mytilus trossulus TaxID=6551 RepID=UPI003006DBC5